MSLQDFNAMVSNAVSRTLLHIVRQSTQTQREENEGSGKYQLSVRDFCREMGWPDQLMETLDARGESGSRGDRLTFHYIVEQIRTGKVGGVAFARDDRLGRTALESEGLLKAAAEHQTLIITQGRIYNPASASDKLILGLMAQFAEYENNARTLWMMATRFALAKDGAYRIVLPTGLIAGSPEDKVFTQAIADAGLDSHLDNLAEHKVSSKRKGRPYYIFPYPDKDVYKACRLRMEWMLATRDIEQVIEKICTDPEYPKPGLVPASLAIRRYHEEIDINWLDVRSPHGRGMLRRWFCSPALYGTYQFSSPGLAKRNPHSKENYTVRIENAFPGFAPPEEEERIRSLIEGSAREKLWMQGDYDGPRPHLLPELRCGHRDGNGKICRRKLCAMYQPDGKYSYYSHPCRFDDHPTQHIFGPAIDRVVETKILELLDPARLKAAMASLAVNADGAKLRFQTLERERATLERRTHAVQELILQATIDKQVERKLLFTKQLDDLLQRTDQVERRIAEAQADLDDFQELAEHDRARILNLGADLKTLLAVARAQNPHLLRALMREVLDHVRFVRISGWACHIDLIFPGGGEIPLELMTRSMKASRVALEYAAGRLAAGDAPAKIAEQLNLAPPLTHSVPWDEERVLTAPIALREQSVDEIRAGPHLKLSTLARKYGTDWKPVFIAAVRGELGPGYYKNGELYVCPEQSEVHRRIPGAAQRWAAQKMGWPVELTVPRSEASGCSGLSRAATVTRARKGSGIVKDAAGIRWVCAADFERRP